ncbi:unnamed protein product [Mytilus coruscus]|uniref:Uncharacterized protein n=1 Tax=Mytilus coruscus TaxID=42192 RepID=A0A6J8E813_MYTCO|nr:unnamed protein product [Mytilus coruscus]
MISGGFMCYLCKFASDETGILQHTLIQHGDHESTFSIRKSIFDEKLGCFAYRSLHFPARISDLKPYHERGYILNINIETSRISFKRKLESYQYTQETHLNEKSIQTENSNIFDLLSEGIDTLKEMDRGFKGQGLRIKENENISQKECRINFVVPSNPTLTRESSKYTVNAENPGLLSIPLDAFAAQNIEKDVKLSIDGKKIALGLGDVGDENLGGYETSPTLQDRKTRLEIELKNLTDVKPNNEQYTLDGTESMDNLSDQDSEMIKGAS